MKLFEKLALLSLAMTLLPLGATGFSLIRLQRTEVAKLSADKLAAAAESASARAADALAEVSERVAALLRVSDPSALTVEERRGLLRAVSQLHGDIVTASWWRGAERLDDYAAAAAAGRSAAHVDALDARLPAMLRAQANANADAVVLVSEFDAGSAFVLLPVAGGGADVVVIELAERILADALNRLPEAAHAVLLGRGGEVRVQSRARLLGDAGAGRGALALPPVARTASTFRFTLALPSGEREAAIGALRPVAGTPSALLVFEPERTALAAVHQMQRITLGALLVSAVAAVVAGALASRGFRRRVSHYEAVARALGQGAASARVTVDTADELGLLGETLNTMASNLEASRAEIERWNAELQQRVDAATAELKAAQERLIRAARLAAVGQLGAGVAHEIGNPLARIIGHAQLVKLDPALPKDALDSVSKIELAAQRVDTITKTLLRFSETQALPPEPGVPLDEIVASVLPLVRSSIEEAGITLTTAVASGVTVTGQRAQLISALFQLLDNARKATPSGGTITVSVSVAGGAPRLSVRDTGCGIPAEHHARIFDPFFSTKADWDSPGLGLSLVYRTAESHGAQLGFTSTVNAGSEFFLDFPAPRAA